MRRCGGCPPILRISIRVWPTQRGKEDAAAACSPRSSSCPCLAYAAEQKRRNPPGRTKLPQEGLRQDDRSGRRRVLARAAVEALRAAQEAEDVQAGPAKARRRGGGHALKGAVGQDDVVGLVEKKDALARVAPGLLVGAQPVPALQPRGRISVRKRFAEAPPPRRHCRKKNGGLRCEGVRSGCGEPWRAGKDAITTGSTAKTGL